MLVTWMMAPNSTRPATGNEPLEVTIGTGGVIARGWDEGLQGIRVGGTRKLIVPPDLAYGDQAVGDVIPANATLTFEIELLSIK